MEKTSNLGKNKGNFIRPYKLLVCVTAALPRTLAFFCHSFSVHKTMVGETLVLHSCLHSMVLIEQVSHTGHALLP